jgi:hypothetical protein
MLMTIDRLATSPPPARLLVNEQDLLSWLSAARPGEQFTYHRGFLAIDTSMMATKLPPPPVPATSGSAARIECCVATPPSWRT